MRSSIKILLALLCTLVLALVPGCASSTGDGDGDGDGHSLGWGRALADAVRDTELPDGSLYNILCPDITADGEPAENIPWNFYYAELPGEEDEDVLIVTVQYDGSTFVTWDTDSSLPPVGLPDYDDAEPWVDAAIEAMDAEGYSDWNPWWLFVEPYDEDDFPDTVNWTVIAFTPEDFQQEAIVAVDADTNEVLDVQLPDR